MRTTTVRKVRGKTIVIQGKINRLGSERDLVAMNDELVFRIANKDTMAAVLTKRVGDGITVDSTGRYAIRIEPEESSVTQQPLSEYWHELEIIEGDTGEEYPIRRGPWYWLDSPN